MTLAKRIILLTTALLLFAGVVAAQTPSSTAPIKVKVKTVKPKKEKFKGEVIVMTRLSITVRDRVNKNLLRTFTFDDEKLAAKMAKRMDENKPYQFGDRVEVIYLAGTDKAVKIKGKAGQNR